MHEMIFRGKRTDNGEWVEGSYFDGEKFSIIITEIRLTDSEHVYTAHGFDVMRDTVGRYTGLTDKNGIPIFEGDIVDILGRCQVLWYDCGWVFRCIEPHNYMHLNACDYAHAATVIGNIHDNPELTGRSENDA